MKNITCLLLVAAALVGVDVFAVPRSDFQIRDPFVLADNGIYYLYRSMAWMGGRGVGVATSKDLENWSEFKLVTQLDPSVKHTAVWAPEVHKYNGSYWIFTTLTFDPDPKNPIKGDFQMGFKGGRLQPRGVWVFKGDKPEGPFLPVKNGPVTPADWMCLDGTLVVEDGKPWMVFCHEWCQLGNGSMKAAPLSDDLSHFTAPPVELFRAACRPGYGHVTDGPYFIRDGKDLRMIWSNFLAETGYCVLQCRSATGKVTGPWVDQKVLYRKNGGHGMLFRKFDGQLMLSLHQPNNSPHERMKLFKVELSAEGLKVENNDQREERCRVNGMRLN